MNKTVRIAVGIAIASLIAIPAVASASTSDSGQLGSYPVKCVTQKLPLGQIPQVCFYYPL